MKKHLINILLVQLIFLQGFSQNVGIGNTNPSFQLDVSGRMRIRTSNQTAGIYFDGTLSPNRSFIGTFDNNHFGIYGAGSGWKMAMNVNTGDVGIGNTNPTAALDVSGSLRFRGGDFPNQPRAGSLLTSLDELGNTEWQRPVVFKTNGLNANMAITPWQWNKILFKSTGLEINEGFYFDPFTSTFNAPVNGFYHFDASLFMFTTTVKSYMRIVVVRNGAVIREYRDQDLICDDCWNGAIWNNNDDENKMRYKTFSVTVGIPLLKNDKVWLEAYCSKFDEEVSGMEVQADPKGTWFSGHLVNRL